MRRLGVKAAVLVATGCLVLGAGVVVPPAAAKPPAAARKKAKRLDKVGKKAFKRGAYGDAVTAFRAAYQANPLPKYLFNLAKALQRKGDLEATIAALEEYLGLVKDRGEREEVEEALDFLRAKLAETKVRLAVTTRPAAAALRLVCGERTVRGSTPWSAWVEPGRYELFLTQEGYVEARREIDLAVGEPVEVEVVLAEERAEAEAEPPPPDGDSTSGLPEVASPREAEPQPSAGVGVLPVVALGTAAAALVAGGVLGWLSRSKAAEYDEYRADPGAAGKSREEARQVGDAAVRLGVAAVAALAAAGVAGTTGGVLLLMGGGEATPTIGVRWRW